ncbi:hypothetical protein J1N35_020020 [Gossypium stocksii]|uniref:Uncharacterized protein n=1 Tax=Gossypium stocksii TaxID=47602 RepID=A0A9D4A126_9ROSI|nr:hypothetical protein J1N35_020020 [Gossypium stocksii]
MEVVVEVAKMVAIVAMPHESTLPSLVLYTKIMNFLTSSNKNKVNLGKKIKMLKSIARYYGSQMNGFRNCMK